MQSRPLALILLVKIPLVGLNYARRLKLFILCQSTDTPQHHMLSFLHNSVILWLPVVC
jgi:hypothetical protein